MAYTIVARTPDGEDRSSTNDLAEARRSANLKMIGYLREHAWCVANVYDDAGEAVYTRLEGAQDA